MTALNIATDIPSSIVTLEQLNMWSNKCLANLYPDTNATEGENYSQRAAQSGTFYIATTNNTRHVGRTSLPLSADYLVGGLKPWMYAQDLGTKPLTAAMKAN
jgi:hypothetical protein